MRQVVDGDKYQFALGGAAADFLRFNPRSIREDSPRYYSTLQVDLALRVGRLSGDLAINIMLRDIVVFEPALRAVFEAESDRAEFTSVDFELGMTFERGARGDISLTGYAVDSHFGVRNTLNFIFAIDQSYLPPVLSAMRRILADFS